MRHIITRLTTEIIVALNLKLYEINFVSFGAIYLSDHLNRR